MSINLGLVYALRLGNRVHCSFIYTFFVMLLLLGVFGFSCTLSDRIRIKLNRFIYGTLTDATTP